MSKQEIALPSVLAFERKLEVSDALMYSGNWSDLECSNDNETRKLWKKISVTPRKNRSTQSAEGIKDIKKTQPNPVASGDDQAVIPSGCDTLKVSWTLRIIGNVGNPFSCNNSSFENAIKNKVREFKGAALETLAFRYAYNIVNGRFLWRNRVCAESVGIQVSINSEEKPLFFNAYNFSLRDFETKKDDDNLKKITDVIYNGLMDETGENFSCIKVNAFIKLDESQQVFPSQEMNMGEEGKVLFQLNDCAAIHNVKIGNAIRTIDTWYGDDGIAQAPGGKNTIKLSSITDKTPIAIEPYGSVTQQGIAYRPKNDDLYTLMLNWVNEKTIEDEDKNYVIANLIRGGVFSKSKG